MSFPVALCFVRCMLIDVSDALSDFVCSEEGNQAQVKVWREFLVKLDLSGHSTGILR